MSKCWSEGKDHRPGGSVSLPSQRVEGSLSDSGEGRSLSEEGRSLSGEGRSLSTEPGQPSGFYMSSAQCWESGLVCLCFKSQSVSCP